LVTIAIGRAETIRISRCSGRCWVRKATATARASSDISERRPLQASGHFEHSLREHDDVPLAQHRDPYELEGQHRVLATNSLSGKAMAS